MLEWQITDDSSMHCCEWLCVSVGIFGQQDNSSDVL